MSAVKKVCAGSFVEVLSNYLDVKIPEELIPVSDKKLLFLNESAVGRVVLESGLQRHLSKAVIDVDKELVMSNFNVELRHCEGHFPDHPLLPMGLLGHVMSQAASMLVRLPDEQNNNGGADTDMITMASQVQSIQSFSPRIEGRKKYFIIPGDKLLVCVQGTGDKVSVHSFRASVYIDGALIARMDFMHSAMARRLFEKLYHRQV